MSRKPNQNSKSRGNSSELAPFYIVAFLLIFFGLLLLIRIRPSIFIFVMAIFLLFSLAVYLYHYYTGIREQRSFEKSTEGMIQKKMKDCKRQMEKNKTEIEDIHKSISEIEERRLNSRSINEETLKESDRLIEAFQQEMQLREAKIGFYRSCYNKLLTIRDNHNMVQELVEKQEQLKKLQEGHYEELADMEELKSNLAYDTYYLDTIDQLSMRMLESHSVDSAKELQLELNVMTKELKKL